jgi:methionyl-tRNA formyltransferase
VTPADPADPALLAEIAAIQPDFIFSFYYRRMLPASVLGLARRGA